MLVNLTSKSSGSTSLSLLPLSQADDEERPQRGRGSNLDRGDFHRYLHIRYLIEDTVPNDVIF
jgi:hypothetical protein